MQCYLKGVDKGVHLSRIFGIMTLTSSFHFDQTTLELS